MEVDANLVKFTEAVKEIAKTQLFEAYFYYEIPSRSTDDDDSGYLPRPHITIRSLSPREAAANEDV